MIYLKILKKYTDKKTQQKPGFLLSVMSEIVQSSISVMTRPCSLPHSTA